MKNLRWTILAALILAAPTAVQAQDNGTTPATTEAGAVSNADATTTATTTASPGIGDEATTEGTTTVDETTQTTELANTGGEPLLMSLGGMSLAMGAFFLRRRVSN